MEDVVKVNGKVVREFNSYDDYYDWTDNYEDENKWRLSPVVIDDGYRINCDMFTKCKSMATAMDRFEKAFSFKPELKGWFETMRESFKNGYLQDVTGCYPSWTDDRKEINKFLSKGTYAFGIENDPEDKDMWYIFLNASGKYVGRN